MKGGNKGFGSLSRREFLYWSAAGLAAGAFGGLPGGYASGKKTKYGGRLRVGERYAPTGLDAHRNQNVIDFFNYVLMYNALTIMGPLPQVRIYPDVAKSWEVSRDGREYTFP